MKRIILALAVIVALFAARPIGHAAMFGPTPEGRVYEMVEISSGGKVLANINDCKVVEYSPGESITLERNGERRTFEGNITVEFGSEVPPAEPPKAVEKDGASNDVKKSSSWWPWGDHDEDEKTKNK